MTLAENWTQIFIINFDTLKGECACSVVADLDWKWYTHGRQKHTVFLWKTSSIIRHTHTPTWFPDQCQSEKRFSLGNLARVGHTATIKELSLCIQVGRVLAHRWRVYVYLTATRDVLVEVDVQGANEIRRSAGRTTDNYVLSTASRTNLKENKIMAKTGRWITILPNGPCTVFHINFVCKNFVRNFHVTIFLFISMHAMMYSL